MWHLFFTGFVELVPQAIKDAEGVGKHMQFFQVSRCQAGALELGIARPDVFEFVHRTAQRVLLREGDTFFLPPGNVYRLENHSTKVTAKIFWTIIFPLQSAGDEKEDASTEVSPGSNSTVTQEAHRYVDSMDQDM